jgi:uncharacterized protein (DUF885 family)
MKGVVFPGLISGALLLMTNGPASAADAPVSPQAATPAPNSADARLRTLYESEWTWRQQALGRGGRGDEAGMDHLPHVDAKSQAGHLAYWMQALHELAQIPFDQLSPEEKVNAEVFRRSVQTLADDARFKTYEAPFNADTFFWASLSPRGGLHSVRAYRNYIARMRDIPRYFDDRSPICAPG